MAVSSSATAGISVACVIGGALLCALVFFLVGRRWKRQSAAVEGNNETVIEELGLGEKVVPAMIDGRRIQGTARLSTTGTSSSFYSGSSRSSVAAVAAAAGRESEEDGDANIKDHFHRLNVAILGHASLYYSLTPIGDGDKGKFCDTNLPTLHEILGSTAPVDARAMDGLLQNPQTRLDAIRLLIAWAVFKYIQPDSSLERTLLPPELVKCAQAMSRSTVQEVVQETKVMRKSMPGQTAKATTTAADDHLTFAKWRETSGKLFEPIYGDGTVHPGDSREHNIGGLVTTLVCLLQPYVTKGYGGARVRDLENVIKSATAFGYKLFTQRTEWEFAWSTLMSDELVVFPALVKIGDERGNRMRKSVVLDWEDSVRMGGSVESLSRKRGSGSGSLTHGIAIAVAV